MKHIRMVAALPAAVGVLAAQSPRTPDAAQQADSPPVFRVTSVARNAKAINYLHRSGATKIDFVGTSLVPAASGEAKVESKRGTEQGIASASITTRGLGKTRPTASNESAAGRQENRRVELVISGGIIDSSAGLAGRAGQ